MPAAPPESAPTRIPALCALTAGLLVSLLAAIGLKKNQDHALREEVRKLAQDRTEVIRAQLVRSMEVLQSVASFFDARGSVSREEFHAFVDRPLARQPELQALAWDARVPGPDRAEWEARARREGFPRFMFTEEASEGVRVPAAVRDEYFPVFYVESLSKNAPAFGFDVNSEPRRRAALEEARASGSPAATAPIRLAQESGSQRGFIVFCPLYSKPAATPEERRALLTGFATAVFRIGDLVELSLRPMGENGVALTIRDEGSGETIYRQEADRLPDHPDWRSTIEVAGRQWALRFEPTSAFPGLHAGLLPWLVPGAGLVITGLLTSYLWSSARQAARLRRSHTALREEVAVRQQAEAAADSASRAKSDFLASMSHEIRTPMHAILGYSQILARDETLPSFHRDAVATILSSGGHLLRLIDEILDLSKIDAGRMEIARGDFDLAALLDELTGMVQPACEEKNLGLRCEGPPRPTPLHGDEGKLRQVLLNLLANAVKFTQQGRVVLRASPVDGDSWQFEVEDSGIGIPLEDQAKIFEPFQQGPAARRQGGTGLGLAIARRQVELMGGRLTVDSVPGARTRFRFTLALPAASGREHGGQPSGSILRLSAGQQVRALVVDDIAENRHILATMLTMVGCEVVLAEHGRQAVEVVRVSRPQIIFLDMRMLESDGIEAARRIVETFGASAPKIVATSASALTHERDHYLQAGCDDFVAKPFRAERIHGCLRQWLGVTFDHEPWPEKAEATQETIDLLQLTLPEDLAARLAMAAELHSATVLKSCLAEVEVLGPAGQRVAIHLRGFLASYDMKTIQRLVAQIPVEASAAV